MSQPIDRLWGARFKSGPSAALAALSRCPERYFRLTPYDLAGSRAHAREVQRAGAIAAAPSGDNAVRASQSTRRCTSRSIDCA